METADDSLLARSSAIVENKNDPPADFPAKLLIEYEPAVTSFYGLRFKSHICDLQIAIRDAIYKSRSNKLLRLAV